MIYNKFNNTNALTRLFISTTLFCSVLISTANAGLITQHVSVSAYDRSCPGLSDPDYITNNLAGIEAIYGPLDSQGSQAIDTACRFNSAQSRYYNNDGSPKFYIPGRVMPTIPAFTNDQVGSLTITNATATDNLSVVTETGRLQGEIVLDSENLGLPEIKINATAGANERNSFNGYAATEYLWTGADETLEFQLNFDFYHSSEEWEFDGYQSTETSEFLLNAYVSEGLIIDPVSTFPANDGDLLGLDSFLLSETDVGDTSADFPYYGNLTVSFDVVAGQTFFVVGQYQGFAKNGGFLNAFNTITGALNIEGFSQEESKAIFETSLELAPVTSVNTPNILLLTILGGLGCLLMARVRS